MTATSSRARHDAELLVDWILCPCNPPKVDLGDRSEYVDRNATGPRGGVSHTDAEMRRYATGWRMKPAGVGTTNDDLIQAIGNEEIVREKFLFLLLLARIKRIDRFGRFAFA